MSMQSADPNAGPAEAIEPLLHVDEPNSPLPPVATAQTFECDKCGATFADEGSAAAHIQTCKGLGVDIPESGSEEEEKEKPVSTSQPGASESHRSEARGAHIAFTAAA